jgi:WXXGXW repeat (2 copies)
MRFRIIGQFALIATVAFTGVAGSMPTASAQSGPTVTRRAPPAPRYERRGPARAGYEWVPGYWHWSRGRYEWVPGYWTRVRRGWVWQPARWERRYDGWVFVPGRWVRSGHRRPAPPPRPPYDRPGPGPGYGRGYWERQGWYLLGEQWVSGSRDYDYVPIGRRQGRFSRILLVAENNDVMVHDVVLVFSNGRSYSPRLRHHFREGSRSRILLLPGGPRGLRSIRLYYGTWRPRGRALVQVWAK